MATWHGSKPYIVRMEVYHPPDYYHSSYEDCEYSWEYNTTADCFTVYEKQGSYEKKNRYTWGPQDCEGLLYILAEWYNNYNGPEALDELIAKIRQEDKT